MIRVGIVGGRGYVGGELIRLLVDHPNCQIAYVGSASLSGQLVTEHIDLSLDGNLVFQPLDASTMLNCGADIWILAQPNGEAAFWVEQLTDSGARFLDISYDHRLDPNWVYGLPERNRDQIRDARWVSNPGCYATATQLALVPALDWIADTPTAFGISGYSGAGKKPSERNDPARLANNLIPYSLVGHGHEIEISHHLQQAVNFIPHVAAFFRGISVTLNLPLRQSIDLETAVNLYQNHFASEPFVQVQQGIPEIRDVCETNQAIIGGFCIESTGKRLVVISVIDNLLKGAASQAIQNLNLMFNLDETLGLRI